MKTMINSTWWFLYTIMAAIFSSCIDVRATDFDAVSGDWD